MSDHVIHTTGKLSDAQIISLFDEISSRIKTDHVNLRYGQVSTTLLSFKEIKLTGRTYIINRVSAVIDGGKFTLNYGRGFSTFNPQNGHINIEQRTSSPYFDEIIVQPRNNSSHNNPLPSFDEIALLEHIIAKHIVIKRHPKIEDGAGSAIDVLQRELSNITEVHSKLLSDAVELRRRNEAELEERNATIDAYQAQRIAEIDAYKEKAEKEIAEKEQLLASREKALDDRNHMHVRRQLREQITTEIQNRVNSAILSKRSKSIGGFVFGLTIVCAIISGYFSYISYVAFAGVVSLPEGPGRDWTLLLLGARAIVSVVATLGFLVYAIAWLRRNYDEDVKLNNELHRYALDLNRASWIIETVMEMSSKEGLTPPDKWIDGVTHGMFQSPNNNDDNLTPLEALGSLLNVTARAEIGPGGTKLEFDRKNLKQIAKSGESKE